MGLTRRTFLGSLASSVSLSGITAVLRPHTPTATASPSPSADGTAAQSLRMGVPASALSLDPVLATDVESHRLLRQIYDTLVGVDLNTGEPVAGLAESWSVSDDQREVTFQLRSGVQFHDGTELTSDVVVDNFKRWATTDERLGDAGLNLLMTLSFYTVFGGFSGDENCLYDGCEAVDDTTVRLTTTEPVVNLMDALTDPAFSITAPSSWENADADTRQRLESDSPVTSLTPMSGTGRYQVEVLETAPRSFRLTQTATANDESSGTAPQRVDVVVVDDAHRRLVGLRTAQLDLYDAVAPATLRHLVQAGAQVLQRDPLSVLYLGLNLEHPMVSSLRFRQAVATAVNRSELVEQTMLSGSTGADTFIPPALAEAPEQLQRYDYDAAEATRLLEASGYDGEELVFTYPVDASRPYLSDPQRAYSLISADLSAIGMRIIPDPVEWDAGYLKHVTTAGGSSGSSRAFHLLGRNSTYRDPLHLLSSTFATASDEFGYLNRTVVNRLRRARTATDSEYRKRLIHAVSRSLALDLPAVPLAFPISALATGPNVSYYPISPVLDEHFDQIRLNT